MPLPADAISRLDDHFGQYVICVTCKACQHTGELDPAARARRYGWKKLLASIVKNLRCAKCKQKQCTVEIAFDEKPRGWVSNPS